MPFLRWIYERIGQFVCWCAASFAFVGAANGINDGDGGGAGGMFAAFLISGVVLRATMILRKNRPLS